MRHVVLSQSRLRGVLLENKTKVLIDRTRLVGGSLAIKCPVLFVVLKPIDDVPQVWVRHRYVVRRDPYHFTVLLVQGNQVAVPRVPHRVIPTVRVCELSQQRAGDILLAEGAFVVVPCAAGHQPCWKTGGYEELELAQEEQRLPEDPHKHGATNSRKKRLCSMDVRSSQFTNVSDSIP